MELSRLLLRHAMNGAQPPDEVAAVDAGDFAAWKEIGKSVERHAVVGIVEGRNQNQIVGDVKIGVAGGQPPALEDDGAGKRQGNDPELTSLKIGCGAQAVEIVLERLVVWVRPAGVQNSYHCICRYEASQVVHIAVAVVARNAPPPPGQFV